MRITDLTVHVFTKTLDNPPRNARTTWSSKSVLLVRIQTDARHYGIGEAWVDGGDPGSVKAILEQDVRPLLLGCDPLLTEAVFDRLVDTTIVTGKRGIMHAAASAVDIALWDIKGKVAGLPVYKLIGGYADQVFTYASGGLYQEGKGLKELASEMAGYVGDGFEAVKMKVGAASLDEDVRRVAAVRKAIGQDVKLMADALYAYSVPDAIRFARAIEPHRLEFFEAPVSSYDVEGLARLTAASTTPVAGNEIEFGRDAFRRLIETPAVDVVHVEAVLCGGISEALKIAALAAAHHLPVSLHNSSSIVAFAANLHVAAAISNHHSTEYHMVHRLLFDHVDPQLFARERSWVRMPDRPGLGIDFDPANIA